MKYIYLLISTLATNLSIAQSPVYPYTSNGNTILVANEGAYFKDTLNKFDIWEGTWQYTNGNTIFKIVIDKAEAVYAPKSFTNLSYNYYRDLLNGGYYYKENGIVKTDHLVYTNQNLAPILFAGDYNTLSTTLTLYFRDIDKSPNLSGGRVHLKLLPGSTTQATWVFDASKKRNYSVPDNVVLTKQ